MANSDFAPKGAAPKALLGHIRANYGTVPAFCEKYALDRIKVQRILHEDFRRIDVDFAFAIERATQGAVLAQSWCTKKVRRSATPERGAA